MHMNVKRLARLVSSMLPWAQSAAGFALVFTAVAGTAAARGNPEIDPGSAASALALLSGGAMLLTSRLRRK
jgi:hypothetical protein